LQTRRPIQDRDREAIDGWEKSHKLTTALPLSTQGFHQAHIRLDKSGSYWKDVTPRTHHSDSQGNGRANLGLSFGLGLSANGISRQQLRQQRFVNFRVLRFSGVSVHIGEMILHLRHFHLGFADKRTDESPGNWSGYGPHTRNHTDEGSCGNGR